MEDLLTLEADDLEVPEQQEEGEREQEVEGEQPKEGEQEVVQPKTPITSLLQPDGKRLDPRVSAAIQKVKSEDAEAGRAINKAIQRVAELDREFPGGLSEVRELRDKLDGLGGIETIEEKMESLQELDGLAKMFMDGDAGFVEDLIQSSQESFSALAPEIFSRYAMLNPDGYARYVGQVMTGDMMAKGVPLMLQRLADLLPTDNPKAAKAFEDINTYLGRFRAMAEKEVAEPKPKAAVAPDPKDKPDPIKDQVEVWRKERDTIRKSAVNAEYRRLIGGRVLDTEQKATLLLVFNDEADRLANERFPKWQEKAIGYAKSNNKSAYMRTMKQIYSAVFPIAMGSAIRRAMRGGSDAKQQQQQVKKAAPVGTATPAGFKPAAKEPDTYVIDYGRTTSEMLRNNRAVLRDGSKVYWR